MTQAVERLTERQKECLRLVGQGYTSKEISRQLGISPATVDNHVRAALDTLQVESRAEAARLLTAHQPDQPLTSQPQPLAQIDVRPAQSTASEPRRQTLLARLVPPIGGTRNVLGTEAKLFAIIRVAVLALASLIILTLGVAVLLWLLR